MTRTALQIPTWQLHVTNLIQSVKTYTFFVRLLLYLILGNCHCTCLVTLILKRISTRLLSWVLSRDFKSNGLISLAKMFSHASQHTEVNYTISAYLTIMADLTTRIVS